MIIKNTFIPGLKLIYIKNFNDLRGSFLKVFNENLFVQNGLETNFKENYFSISRKNVIRGMHFQVPPFEHIKLVSLIQGEIIDVVLDIRQSSPTYGKYFSIRFNAKNPLLVYIPIGCAHGFLSLEDNTIVTYLQTSCFNNLCDKGIKYNSFGMNWGIENPILSDRDLGFLNFGDTNFNFS